MRRGAVVLAASLAVLPAGCGGGDEGQVRSAVTDYLHALLRYDGAAACAKLSRATQAEFERLGGGKCPPLLTANAKRELKGQVKQRLEAAQVTKVKLNGTSASATLSVPGRTATISLVKEGGDWKIQSPLG